jgi:hypothetical protein
MTDAEINKKLASFMKWDVKEYLEKVPLDNISDAFEVVEKGEEEGWVWQIDSMRLGKRGCFVSLHYFETPVDSIFNKSVNIELPDFVKDLPRAISLAAIKVIDEKCR